MNGRSKSDRHFILEKYIDKGMPDLNQDLDQLSVPADFLWEALIFNNQAAPQYLT